MHRQNCKILILLVFMLFPSATSAAKRNILLIVADDHGQDAGCYGNPIVKTPSLDSLAQEGTLFTHAFATTASCSASRSVILTGLYSHRTGQYGHAHDYHHFRSFENLKSLPVLLEQSGYRTASVGKYHVAPRQVFRFQHFLPGSGRNPVEMANNAKGFISSGSKPFFLYFCTSDPHRGGGQASELPYKPNRFGNRPEGYAGITPVVYDPNEVIVPPFLPDTPTSRAELAQYYQSISRIDQGLARLMQILKDADVYNDTLIIYISDHGIAFPGAKTTVYEPGLRSPCIVRHPYLEKRGVINRAMITWADLTPTILEFAGAEAPEYESQVNLETIRDQLSGKHGLHGRSFLSILEQEDPRGWDEIYASHTFHEIQMYYPMRVVRGRRYKLIWNIAYPLPFPFASDLWVAPTWQEAYQQGMDAVYGKRTIKSYIYRQEFELYDIEKDPHEVNNLAQNPKYAGLLQKLKDKIEAFQKRTSDPWILKWKYE